MFFVVVVWWCWWYGLVFFVLWVLVFLVGGVERKEERGEEDLEDLREGKEYNQNILYKILKRKREGRREEERKRREGGREEGKDEQHAQKRREPTNRSFVNLTRKWSPIISAIFCLLEANWCGSHALWKDAMWEPDCQQVESLYYVRYFH